MTLQQSMSSMFCVIQMQGYYGELHTQYRNQSHIFKLSNSSFKNIINKCCNRALVKKNYHPGSQKTVQDQ